MTDEKKIGLLEMIMFLEQEAEDIDTWERVLTKEGKPVYPKMFRRRTILRKVIATLELLKSHEAKFVELVKRGRRDRVSVKPSPQPTNETQASSSENLSSD
jgi:hypothetical protein